MTDPRMNPELMASMASDYAQARRLISAMAAQDYPAVHDILAEIYCDEAAIGVLLATAAEAASYARGQGRDPIAMQRLLDEQAFRSIEVAQKLNASLPPAVADEDYD